MSQNGWVKPDFGLASLDSSHPIIKRQNGTMAIDESSKTKKPSEIIDNIYKPANCDELVVHKKKIAELKCWLEQSVSTANQAQFLLLTGPPGCGKYQTLSMLCKELCIDILSWEEPIKHFVGTELYFTLKKNNRSNHTEISITDVNFYDHLEEFLERASRFCTLRMKNAEVSASQKTTMRKVLLVKDFPPMILQNLERWHNILMYNVMKKYGCKGKTPAIFIFTSSKPYNNMQLKLFPHNLQERLNITTINFSGLANTFVLKALQKVAIHSKRTMPLEVVQGIADSCNGDLRSAMNAMDWMNARSNFYEKKPLFSKKRKLSRERERISFETAYVRDGSIDFMHAVGKILHSKRLNEIQCNLTGLPQHLLGESRMPLKEDVNELTRNIVESSSKVLLFLHQNYPVYFNRIEDASRAIGYLSSVDSFCNQLVCKEFFEEYSLLTAIRGLMFSNTSVNGSSWRPLRKPDYFSVTLKQQELRTEIQRMNGNQYGPSFLQEIWPFTCLIRSGLKIKFGSNQLLERVDGVKSQEHPITISRAMAHVVEESRLPHEEDTRALSEEDANIVIEEYHN